MSVMCSKLSVIYLGGSETFKDKQDFFYHEVRKYHQKHFHDKLVLKIARENLLESVSLFFSFMQFDKKSSRSVNLMLCSSHSPIK